MSFIQNLFTSRDNNANSATYVGQQDRIWWDPVTNAFYYSDGNTAGGIPIGSSSGNGMPHGPANSVQLNAGNGTFLGSSSLTFSGNILTIVGNATANYFIGDGSQLTNLPVQPGTYSNANVSAYLPVYSGNIGGNNIGISGAINAVGEITTFANIVASPGGFFIGNGSQLTGLPVQPGTYSNANVAYYLPTYSGNVGANNVLSNQYLYANSTSIFANTVLTGNINLGNLYVVDQTVGGKDINGNIAIVPEGSGWVTLPRVSIDTLTIANTTGKMEFITPAGVDIQLTPGILGNILTAGNVIPTANNIASLGSADHRYVGLWLGAGNINLHDQSINQDQQIYADNGNLIFANTNGIKFGNFVIYDQAITVVDTNANLEIGLITSNGFVNINRPLTVNSTGVNGIAFEVNRNGYTQINTPFGVPANAPGALNIVGSSDGAYQNVTNSGGMLHITGPANSAARITVDAYGSSNGTGVPSTIVLRSGRGTANTPSATQANDTIGRVSIAGWSNQFGTGGGLAATAIEFVSLENFTPTTQGTKITFNTANTGSNSRSVSATIQANGVSFANNTVANSGITFTDGSFQNTAYIDSTVVRSITAGDHISVTPASGTGNVTITNTGVVTVAGAANQVFVNGANNIAAANGAVSLSLPQDIAPSSNPTFNTLTVNDLVILGNVSNVIPSVVGGKVVYVANTATQLTDIDTSGLVTGNAANGYYAGILYQTTGTEANTWDFTVGNSIGVNAGYLFANTANITGNLHIGSQYIDGGPDYVNALLHGAYNGQDSYIQYVLQNLYPGASASADYVAVNDIGDDGNNYIDMGINSSVYANADYLVTRANDGYMYVNGGNLVIGTQTAGKTINFFTGGTNSATAYNRASITDAGLSVVGNITGNNITSINLTSGGNVSATGNVTGAYLNGTAGISTAGNVIAQNVNTGIVSATGNVVAGNVRTGNINATGNITAVYLITANTVIDNGISTTGTITAAAITATTVSGTGNITGTTINATTQFISPLISVTGNITGGNLLTNGYISTTGNATFGNLQTTGRINVTGNVDAGNLRTGGQVVATTVSATGNINGAYFNGNGYYLTGLNAFQTVAANGTNLTANTTAGIYTITPGNNMVITGNATTVTSTFAVADAPTFSGNVTAGNILTGGIVSSTGNVVSGNIRTAGLVTATGNITGGNISATGNISDANGLLRSLPINSQGSAYQLTATDNGNLISITSGNVTVPASVFVSPFGQAVTVYNNSGTTRYITQAANVTLRLAGTAATGNRTLAQYGLATIVCVSANTFVVSGVGLS